MDKNDCYMISIDSSTKKTGIAVWKNGELEKHYLLDFESETDSEKRFSKMVIGINKILNTYRPDIVTIENMNQPRNVAAFRMLCKVLGTVNIWCLLNDCDYIELIPSVWRKYANDKKDKIGNKREDYKAWSISKVKLLYNLDVNDDVADAILIGYGYINMMEKIYK